MIYLGACRGISPPLCPTCENCDGREVNLGYAQDTVQGYPWDEVHCGLFVGQDQPFTADPYLANADLGCLGIPSDASFSLSFDFTWTGSTMCSPSVTVTLDKSSGDPAIAVGGSWTSGAFDPGPWPEFVTEVDGQYSEWISIPGARRDFRVRVELSATYNVGECGIPEDNSDGYRYVVASLLVFLEWRIPEP